MCVKFHCFRKPVKCEENLQFVILTRRWRPAEYSEKDLGISGAGYKCISHTPHKTVDVQMDNTHLWKREWTGVTSFHAK